MMQPRNLAAIISSLVSQLLLLLLLLFPSNTLNTTTDPLFPLLHHSLFSNQIASTLSLKRKRKRKRPNNRHDPEHDDSDPSASLIPRAPDAFRNTFMMSSSTFHWLSGLLEPLLDCRDPSPPLHLSSSVRLAIGLFRLAAGSDYPDISSRFGVPLSVAKFCVKQLCRVLCTNFRFWISFPSPSLLPSVSSDFQSLSDFPNCCGILSCSRFPLLHPRTPSLAAQFVVDSRFRILSVVAGFLGHKSDATILNASTLFKDIQDGKLLSSSPAAAASAVRQYFVAGSSYPLLPWLVVPFADPLPASVEENFNAVHRAMLAPALRTAASLRNWGVLSKPVSEEVKMVVAYIGACSILHNSLLMREDFSALASEFEDDSILSSYDCGFHEEVNFAVDSKGLALRSTLATMAKSVHKS